MEYRWVDGWWWIILEFLGLFWGDDVFGNGVLYSIIKNDFVIIMVDVRKEDLGFIGLKLFESVFKWKLLEDYVKFDMLFVKWSNGFVLNEVLVFVVCCSLVVVVVIGVGNEGLLNIVSGGV